METKTKVLVGGGLALAFAGVAAVGGIYAYNQMFGFSDSSRSVYNIKFGEKGSVCKTWEGEGTLVTPSEIGGQGVTSTFKFSVLERDKEAIAALQEAAKHPTKMFTLDYTQVKWYVSCQHSSEYLIKKVGAGEDANPYIIGGAYKGQPVAPVTPAPNRR